jgi:hypothetical protein
MIFMMLCQEIFIAIDNSNPVSLYFNWVLIERLKKLETYSSLEMVFVFFVKPIIKKDIVKSFSSFCLLPQKTCK